MRPFKTYMILTFALFAFPVFLCGQDSHSNIDTLFDNACRLQERYSFEDAENIYNELLDYNLDSSLLAEIHTRIIQCHNGGNLLGYIVRPVAIATDDRSVENFFLHMEDSFGNSWMDIPNPFVNIPPSAANPFCNGTYFSTRMEEDGTIIYSAPNEAGQWKIYTSSRIDSTLWSLPQLLSANISSGGNEIFPQLSPDGHTLYFASDALAGMGGYDLFYSTLDPVTGSWSSPENLGFPYSSTGNDIFYADSPDGKYTIIVSDRETSEGKVRIYVTRHIPNAVKTRIEDDEDPVAIASMKGPIKGTASVVAEELHDSGLSHTDSLLLDYSNMMSEMERLQTEHKKMLSDLEKYRILYENATEEDKKSLSETIITAERETMMLKKQIDSRTKEVQKAEMDFLADGIVPEIINVPVQKPVTEVNGIAGPDTYIFPDHQFRTVPYIVLEQPKPKFDYTFRIRGKNEGQFAEDQSLPDGIVYQIQFAVLSKKAGIKDLKGLSPVYAYRQSSGKYIHTVGLFRTYAEGSAKVKAVRNAGFKEAFLVAYKNGKSISVKTARQQEGKPAANAGDNAWQLVISGYADTLPSGVITAIRDASDKDITKTTGNAGTRFIVGPFSGKSEASDLAELLEGLGVNGITIETINIKQ